MPVNRPHNGARDPCRHGPSGRTPARAQTAGAAGKAAASHFGSQPEVTPTPARRQIPPSPLPPLLPRTKFPRTSCARLRQSLAGHSSSHPPPPGPTRPSNEERPHRFPRACETRPFAQLTQRDRRPNAGPARSPLQCPCPGALRGRGIGDWAGLPEAPELRRPAGLSPPVMPSKQARWTGGGERGGSCWASRFLGTGHAPVVWAMVTGWPRLRVTSSAWGARSAVGAKGARHLCITASSQKFVGLG